MSTAAHSGGLRGSSAHTGAARDRAVSLRHVLLGAAVVAWVVFVSAASLKEMVPYVHWIATLPIVAALCSATVDLRWKPLQAHFLFSGLLVFSIVLVSLNSATPDYEVIQACKLAVILLVLVPLFSIRQQSSGDLLRGTEAASAINMAVVLLGLAGVHGLFSMMATARFGTILNSPGSLWRAGCLAFMWGLLQLVFHRVSTRYAIVFFSAAALMVLDGSRTAYLLIGLGAVFLVFVALLEPRSRARSVVGKLAAAGVLLILCVALIGYAAVQGELELGFVDRGTEFLKSASQLGLAGLRSADDVRAGALERVLQAIGAHPFVGFGMGTTKSQSSIGPMVVHLAYLQVWADIGILGFLGYLGVHASACRLAWVRFRDRARYALSQRLAIYSAIYLLMVWMVAGLFHPVSTEISEWILFLIAVAILHAPPALHTARDFVGGGNV